MPDPTRLFLITNEDHGSIRQGPLAGLVLPFISTFGGVPALTYEDEERRPPGELVPLPEGMFGAHYLTQEFYVGVGDGRAVMSSREFLRREEVRRLRRRAKAEEHAAVYGIGTAVRYIGEYLPQPTPEGDIGGLEPGTIGLVAGHRRSGATVRVISVVFPGWLFVWDFEPSQIELASRESIVAPLGYRDEHVPVMIESQAILAERISSVVDAQLEEARK